MTYRGLCCCCHLLIQYSCTYLCMLYVCSHVYNALVYSLQSVPMNLSIFTQKNLSQLSLNKFMMCNCLHPIYHCSKLSST